MYQVLDLFSGIGGFSLGLERAGMETVAFCESDGYARQVLHKHWPQTWIYEDIRTLTIKKLKKDGLNPNVVCGGFPCQDISCAGKGAGIEGERSGLWAEMFRLIKEIKPIWVIAENVPALRGRGADRVLADLEGAGYAVEPLVVGAVHVGARHRRERVWIVGHSQCNSAKLESQEDSERHAAPSAGRHVAHAKGSRHDDVSYRRDAISGNGCKTLAHAQSAGYQARCANGLRKGKLGSSPFAHQSGWQVEPDVGRVADGIPARVDRLRCLGNAVVPQIPELIGRFIVQYDKAIREYA